jgi:hypothetical protein
MALYPDLRSKRRFPPRAFLNNFSPYLAFSVTPLDPGGLLAIQYAIPAGNVCTYLGF